MSPSVLDVLTYNVWGLPWPLAADRKRRYGGIAEHLAQRADHVVGLQEVWGSSHRQLPVPGLQRGTSRRDAGLALGGLLEAEEPARLQHFGRAAGTDALKSKGVLQAPMLVHGTGTVQVFVTHLQAHARYASTRAHQVDELLEAAAGTRRPVVVLGDFNFHDEQADDRHSHERLLAEGFVDAAEAAGVTDPTWDPEHRYARGRHGAQRFDRVYVRGSSTVAMRVGSVAVLQPETPLSDHLPVHARIVLARR